MEKKVEEKTTHTKSNIWQVENYTENLADAVDSWRRARLLDIEKTSSIDYVASGEHANLKCYSVNYYCSSKSKILNKIVNNEKEWSVDWYLALWKGNMQGHFLSGLTVEVLQLACLMGS